MTSKMHAIAEEASKLEPRERVEIIEALLKTLEPEPTEDPAKIESAWRSEVTRRSNDLKAGLVKSVPWDQVRSEGEQLFNDD